MIASTKAQMPIQTSRPTTFIRVIGEHRLVAGAGDAGTVAGEIAVGLRRGEAGRVGEFRRADPGAADAGRQMQQPRATNGSTKIITIAQMITDGDGDRRVFLLGADRAGDGDRGGNAADRAAGAERRRQPPVEAELDARPR